MSILIVDDSKSSQTLLQGLLKRSGFKDLIVASSAKDAYEILGIGNSTIKNNNIDLILMDNIMPDIDGVEATSHIKGNKNFKDIPVIMITASDDVKVLQGAFDAGAMDFIKKPFTQIELLARVKSSLKLKYESDGRKEALEKLEEANKKLQLLSSLDGLTGIANRRRFDDFLDREWRRSIREKTPLSLIFMDLDYFKKYNDGYGHLAGDDCLKKVANKASEMMSRPGDLAARYGGEEFVIVLGSTEIKTAADLAEKVRSGIEEMKLPHKYREGGSLVTTSLGVAGCYPDKTKSTTEFIKAADKALYKAKEEGRNKVVVSDL